jgi:eukaryotic-like serine/threonine-protein kinase
VAERAAESSEPESIGEDASIATVAATPSALGTEDTAHDAPPRHAADTHLLAGKPNTSQGTASAFPATTEALDQAELPRMRLFATIGTSMAVLALLATLVIGGDPIARSVFRGGLAVVLVTNVWLLWLTGRTQRYQVGPLIVVWVGACFGVMSAVYFFGPYSAAVAAPILGISIAALGKSARLALIVAALCIACHLAMAIPIALGWVVDRSLLHSRMVPTDQLLIAEALLVAVLAASYAMGRWLRRTTSIAMAEVERARRLIGDQEVALAEARADAARVKRVGEGRWTGHKVGSFQLGLVLGRGAMGEVYEGRGAKGDAAVKVLTAKATDSDHLTARFHREMTVAAGLESPHIVKVFEVSPPDAEVPFIAMERLYGRDLAAVLRAVGKLVPDDLLTMIDHVARGLEVARKAGVVHRDLKPHNVFRAEYPDRPSVWKILDFGVSKVIGGEGTLTGEGIVGTPQYMAPEQAAGRQVGPAADIYALAAIVYRCVTGRPPFTDGDIAQLVYKVVHVAPQRPGAFAKISPLLEDVLAVGLAKDPEERFESATAFAHAVAEARRGRRAVLDLPRNPWT